VPPGRPATAKPAVSYRIERPPHAVIADTMYISILFYYHITMSELAQFKAEFFKALAHPLRIRILDELRHGEVGVNALGSRLDVEQSSLSQQLAILRSRNLVITRKEGLNVFYSISDAEIFALLDTAKKIFNRQLVGVRKMLRQL
jgi:DNA-binding transcriptional ArsR family regulator